MPQKVKEKVAKLSKIENIFKLNKSDHLLPSPSMSRKLMKIAGMM